MSIYVHDLIKFYPERSETQWRKDKSYEAATSDPRVTSPLPHGVSGEGLYQERQ